MRSAPTRARSRSGPARRTWLGWPGPRSTSPLPSRRRCGRTAPSSSRAGPAASARSPHGISRSATAPRACCWPAAVGRRPRAPTSCAPSWRSSDARPRSSPATSAGGRTWSGCSPGLGRPPARRGRSRCRTLDDGVLTALDGDRLRRVLRPKLDAAVHLHELTRDPRTGGVRALLRRGRLARVARPGELRGGQRVPRRAGPRAPRRGLPALSWLGFWERTQPSMTRHLTTRPTAAVAPLDLLPMSDELGLTLIDIARGADQALLADGSTSRAAVRAPEPRAAEHPERPRPRGAPAPPRAAGRWRGLGGVAPEADRDRVVPSSCAARSRGAGARVAGQHRADRPRSSCATGSSEATGVRCPPRWCSTTRRRRPRDLLRRQGRGSRRGTGRPRRPDARRDEPIAIVGMACRYPGGVASPGGAVASWSRRAGRDRRVPDRPRLGPRAALRPGPRRPGTIYARRRVPDDAAEFDAGFFGISPRGGAGDGPAAAAAAGDLVGGVRGRGHRPDSLRGSRPACSSARSTTTDYGARARRRGGRGLPAGTARPASRPAGSPYTLGPGGPGGDGRHRVLVVAGGAAPGAQALRQGECRLALAGGVTVMATPGVFVEFSRQRGLAPDGRCKAFAAAAPTAPAGPRASACCCWSGCRTRAATATGCWPWCAAARSTRTARRNGLTAPNGPSQQRVIRAALANAGLAPSDVDAVEAHGTGTTLGDPIEAQALLATYGQDRRTARCGWARSSRTSGTPRRPPGSPA